MFSRLVVIFLVLLANTCSRNKATQQQITSIQQKRWSLTEMEGQKLTNSPVWLEFDATARRFNGNGGCNKVAGEYELTGNEITFKKVISTRMACIDAASNERESALLRMLNDRTYTVRMEEQQLQFRDSGRVALQFTGKVKVKNTK